MTDSNLGIGGEHDFSKVEFASLAFVQNYLGGLAIAITPESEISQAIHNRDLSAPDSPMAIITHAQAMMRRGLKTVVGAAIGDLRLVEAENLFLEVRDFMAEIVDSAYGTRAEQIAMLNGSFLAIQPNPLEDERIYRAICHSRDEKVLPIGKLVRPYVVADYFVGVVSNGASGRSETRIVSDPAS